MKKIICAVLGGSAGSSGKVPVGGAFLDEARTPNLNKLARQGMTGAIPLCRGDTLPDALPFLMSLSGYRPGGLCELSGPIECLAQGLKFNQGDLALSLRFACAKDSPGGLRLRNLGNDISSYEAGSLAREINLKITLSGLFDFKNTYSDKAVMVVRGIRSKFSAAVTNNFLGVEGPSRFSLNTTRFSGRQGEFVPLPGYENNVRAFNAAAVINEFIRKSYGVLSESEVNKKRASRGKNPANIIIIRGAGDCLPEFPQLPKAYGLRFACLSNQPSVSRIAALSGMDIIKVKGRGYNIHAKCAVESSAKYDILCVYLNGLIEELDKKFTGCLLNTDKFKDYILAVVPFYSAYASKAAPLFISGVNLMPGGSLGKIPGHRLLSKLIKIAQNNTLNYVKQL